MKRLTNLRFIAIFALLAIAPFATGIYAERAAAQEAGNQSEQQKPDEQKQEQSDITYDYTAQPGDSYSLIARKAVQTYGLVSKTSLSSAQIIYAETNLTLEAGSPQLNEGQKVSLKESSIKSWVEKSQKLSDSTKKAWDVYAQGADFNTDNVGESR